MGNPNMWRVEVVLPAPVPTEPFEAAIAPNDSPITITRTEAGGWLLAAYAENRPNRVELAARISIAATAVEIELPAMTIERVPDIDWISHVHARTPPIQAGRFYVHGAHVAVPGPDASIDILMEAGPAFGSGDHQSTRGCLIALDRLAQDPAMKNILDLGCGSGILSIAAARIGSAQIIAADIDPDAVEMTLRCANANGLAGRITAVRSRGFQNRRIRAGAPVNLILANILARPLQRLAPAITRHLAPGGRAVLSGLLGEQGPSVGETYDKHGLVLADHLMLDEWLTLEFLKPS